MSLFKAQKVVSTLPTGGAIDADTLYFVRTGAGFDLHLSDTTGSIIYKINGQPQIRYLPISGRLYCYTDGRWISVFDDNYGGVYHQIAESAGTGAEPISEWEWGAAKLLPGEMVTGLHFTGRSTNSEVTDLNLRVAQRVPTGANTWANGIDADGEFINENKISGTISGLIPNYTRNLLDKHAGYIPVANPTQVTDIGEATVCFQATTSGTATRYIQLNCLLEITKGI